MVTNPNYGWIAASYLVSFFAGIFTCLMEVIFWSFLIAGDPDWLLWWVENIAWWWATFGMIFPWLFSIFQYSFDYGLGGLNQDLTEEQSLNAIFLTVGNIFEWINAMTVHVFLTPRLACWVKATEPMRKRIVYKKCPLKKTFGENEEIYQKKC